MNEELLEAIASITLNIIDSNPRDESRKQFQQSFSIPFLNQLRERGYDVVKNHTKEVAESLGKNLNEQ